MAEDPISKEDSGKRPKDWMDHTIRWGWIAIAAIVIIAAITMRETGVKPPEISAAQKAKKVSEFLIPRTCFCGRSKSDAGTIYRAVAASDTEAVKGLLDRGKALRMDKGTWVRVVGVTGGMAYIRILSGYQAGETCWIPEGLL